MSWGHPCSSSFSDKYFHSRYKNNGLIAVVLSRRKAGTANQGSPLCLTIFACKNLQTAEIRTILLILATVKQSANVAPAGIAYLMGVQRHPSVSEDNGFVPPSWVYTLVKIIGRKKLVKLVVF